MQRTYLYINQGIINLKKAQSYMNLIWTEDLLLLLYSLGIR
jgi:hypothetical protein